MAPTALRSLTAGWDVAACVHPGFGCDGWEGAPGSSMIKSDDTDCFDEKAYVALSATPFFSLSPTYPVEYTLASELYTCENPVSSRL